MNRFLPLLAVLLLVGFGCSSQPHSFPSMPTVSTTNSAKSAYTPPTGADLSSGLETPGRRRLMTATSQDGLTFTRTNKIVTDQANVPDLVMDEDGKLYLYFSGWEVGESRNAMGVAISKDQGETWAFHEVTISGGQSMAHSGDPDVILLEDGSFRLYSTSGGAGGTTAIYRSESAGGVIFDYGGVAFDPSPSALDSNTYLAGDTWHMYTLTGNTVMSYHATSNDGVEFERQSREQYTVDGREIVMSNVLPFDGGYRMYGFTMTDIRSLWSADGETWTEEDGVRLSLDESSGLESEYVKDPAVIRLADGTYLMVYVTQIP